ncbi:hypothetical protein PENTCL1PPCAC_8172, partial [Pristionchus entomophagus]
QVGSMPDTMCFQEGAVGTYARPVLNRTETETERACRVACGDDPECTSVSYDQPTCLLLGAPNTSLKCSNPVATLPLKKPTGLRTNLTGNYGNDPCVIKIVPDVLRLDRSPICPRNANNYIIRAIDEFGNRVTLDNDINNMMTFDATRNMWKFYVASTGYTKWVVAASCATAGDACCYPLPNLVPLDDGASAVRRNENGTCYNSPSPQNLKFFGGKFKPGASPTNFTGQETTTMTITCQSGIWLLSYLDNNNGWQIANAS